MWRCLISPIISIKKYLFNVTHFAWVDLRKTLINFFFFFWGKRNIALKKQQTTQKRDKIHKLIRGLPQIMIFNIYIHDLSFGCTLLRTKWLWGHGFIQVFCYFYVHSFFFSVEPFFYAPLLFKISPFMSWRHLFLIKYETNCI